MTCQHDGRHVGVTCTVLSGNAGWTQILNEWGANPHTLGRFRASENYHFKMVFSTGQGQVVTCNSKLEDVQEAASTQEVSSLTMIGECGDFTCVAELAHGFNLWHPHVAFTVVTPESSQTCAAKCLGIPANAQDFASIHAP